MATAFKEWAVVCEALGQGVQSIIFRKRGIAEGRFQFKFREFFLFPTQYHQYQEKITGAECITVIPTKTRDTIDLQYVARIEWAVVLSDWVVIQRLRPYHIWHDSVVKERFQFGGTEQSINLAFVRVYKLRPVWRLQHSPEFGGCRSWIQLPEPSRDLTFTPVIGDSKNRTRSIEIHEIIS